MFASTLRFGSITLAVLVAGLWPSVTAAQGTVPLVRTFTPSGTTAVEIKTKQDSIVKLELDKAAPDLSRAARERTDNDLNRLRQDVRRLQASSDATTCSVTDDAGWKFCGVSFRSETARKAGESFWHQEDAGGFAAAKMLSIQGLGDVRGQRTYVEIVSDLWNLTRVSLGGVFKAGDSTSTKSTVQQFLSGGGPAVVTLLRPIAIANLMNTHSVLLGRGQVSFTVPGQDQTADDSLKFGTIGLDLQTSIQGDSKKIGGLFMLNAGQVFGGRPFYRSFDESRSFFSSSFGIGLLVEESASLTYTRFLTGPRALTSSRDLIGVKFTR